MPRKSKDRHGVTPPGGPESCVGKVNSSTEFDALPRIWGLSPPLSGVQYLILGAICYHFRGSGKVSASRTCYPSYATLAALAGVCEKTVSRATEALEARGILERHLAGRRYVYKVNYSDTGLQSPHNTGLQSPHNTGLQSPHSGEYRTPESRTPDSRVHSTGLQSPPKESKRRRDRTEKKKRRSLPPIPAELKQAIPEVEDLLTQWLEVLPTAKLPTPKGCERTLKRLVGYLPEHGAEKVRRLIVMAADRYWRGMEMDWSEPGRANGGGKRTKPAAIVGLEPGAEGMFDYEK